MTHASDAELIEQFDKDPFLEKFIAGTSSGVRLLRARMALLNSPINQQLVRQVLICGESGSGKNYTARVLAGHRRWQLEQERNQEGGLPMVLDAYTDGFQEVSLPGLSDDLVESELFGHAAGAFTGATEKHEGYFGQGYSDILLDEIGDATLRLQAKLLRVLNNGKYRLVGGTRDDEGTTDARVLMATHRPLESLVANGLFRPDLLWRMREFVLYIPALREQRENVLLIAHKIISELYEKASSGLQSPPELRAEDLAFIESHSWPGNVRELRYTLARWLVYKGARPVREIVRESEAESHYLRANDSATLPLELAVKQMLETARTASEAVADSPGIFVGQFTDRVKNAMSDWMEEVRPSPEELERMFPDSSSGNSIRTQIRKGRTR